MQACLALLSLEQKRWLFGNVRIDVACMLRTCVAVSRIRAFGLLVFVMDALSGIFEIVRTAYQQIRRAPCADALD